MTPYFIALAILILLGYSLYSMIFLSVRTELTYRETLEDCVNLDGYVLRKEAVLISPIDGVLLCNVSENERVRINTNVVSILSEKVDESILARYKVVNESIQEYEKLSNMGYHTDNPYRIESQILSKVNEIIDAAQTKKNITQIPKFKGEVQHLVQKNNERTDPLALLIAERNSLAQQISVVKQISSTVPGVFSSNIDGLEEILSSSKRAELTPVILKSLTPSEITEGVHVNMPVAKIINNFNWYFVAVVDIEESADLEVGNPLSLRLPNIDYRTIGGYVDAINSIEGESEAVLIISCTTFPEEIFEVRELNVDLIKLSYTGLNVPKTAIQTLEDGTVGVYIVKGDIARFRKVEILTSTDSYVLVKENVDESLRNYDEIIVSGKNLSDGKIIR